MNKTLDQSETPNPHEYKYDGQDMDYKLQHAINVIKGSYGHTVSIKQKSKDLLKFGFNPSTGTSLETVSTLGTETYVTTNAITHISSSSASDTGTYSLEYHTVDGSGNFTFGIQTGTLSGQNKVALTTPCARTSRVENTAGANWVGDVYLYEDTSISSGVPADITKAHLQGVAGRNQSFKCSTTLSHVDYFICTSAFLGVKEKVSAFVDGELNERKKGSVFRPRVPLVASSESTLELVFDPCIIFQPNSDINISAEASATNTDVEAWFNGYLAVIV